VLWFQSYTQSVSIATGFIIELRPNMCPVERNSQGKLEGIFPKKEMSLFLASHSTKNHTCLGSKGTKMHI
jgi:hypothetical protein